LIGVVCVLGAAATAHAADVPPPEPGPAEVTVRSVSGQLEIRDVRDGTGIVLPKDCPIAFGFPPSISTSVDVHPQPTGADLVVTAHNNGSAPAALGHINVGVITLGQSIESFDFRVTGTPTALEWSTYVGTAWLYPSDLYSPVTVIRNARYAVGVSVQYPILDYKHDVAINLANPKGSLMTGEGGPGWLASFWLGNAENPNLQWQEGRMQPGETRTYVVSVRVSRNPQAWQGTLLPYRDYFRSKYGAVQYARDSTPIQALALSEVSYLSPSNPFGFATSLRPDINGWGKVSSAILSMNGWTDIMLWAPSGLCTQNRDLNYPYQFTSHWNATPKLATVYSTSDGLPSVVAAGRKLGLWWGHSCDVTPAWDTLPVEKFDPDNASHVRAALAEMDGAVRAGATMVGLDTFNLSETPLWKLYPWLQRLKQTYPNVTFAQEPSVCDIMHTLAPSFVTGWRDAASRPASPDDMFVIQGPNVLADFINPGSETWGGLSYQSYRPWFGNPTPARIANDLAHFAACGYRPVCFDSAAAPQGLVVAKTWETSLPPAIRDADPFIANLRAGRLPGMSGGGSGNGGTAPAAPAPPTPPSPPLSSGTSSGSTGSSASTGAGGSSGFTSSKPIVVVPPSTKSGRTPTTSKGIFQTSRRVASAPAAPASDPNSPSRSGGGETRSKLIIQAPMPRIVKSVTSSIFAHYYVMHPDADPFANP
jgi:hypothetical protein